MSLSTSFLAAILDLKFLSFANNWKFLSGRIHVLASEERIESFGFCLADYVLNGVMSWSSSNRIRLAPGIEWDFDYFGKTQAAESAVHAHLGPLARVVGQGK